MSFLAPPDNFIGKNFFIDCNLLKSFASYYSGMTLPDNAAPVSTFKNITWMPYIPGNTPITYENNTNNCIKYVMKYLPNTVYTYNTFKYNHKKRIEASDNLIIPAGELNFDNLNFVTDTYTIDLNTITTLSKNLETNLVSFGSNTKTTLLGYDEFTQLPNYLKQDELYGLPQDSLKSLVIFPKTSDKFNFGFKTCIVSVMDTEGNTFDLYYKSASELLSESYETLIGDEMSGTFFNDTSLKPEFHLNNLLGSLSLNYKVHYGTLTNSNGKITFNKSNTINEKTGYINLHGTTWKNTISPGISMPINETNSSKIYYITCNFENSVTTKSIVNGLTCQLERNKFGM